MILQHSFYKPKKDGNGSAFTFRYNRQPEKTPAFYITAIQQYSWNDVTKNGSFKENAKNPDKHLNVKMSLIELGDMISFFQKRNVQEKLSFIHDPSKAGIKNSEKVTIQVSRWGDNKENYGIRITKGNLSLGLSLSQGEAELLSVLFQGAISDSLLYQRVGNDTQADYGVKKVDYQAMNSPSEDEDSSDDDDLPF